MSSIRVCSLEDGAAVFDSLSWETHLLNGSAAAALELLAEHPRSEDEIAALLAEMLEEKSRVDAPRHARALLDSLVRLGVIAPVDT